MIEVFLEAKSGASNAISPRSRSFQNIFLWGHEPFRNVSSTQVLKNFNTCIHRSISPNYLKKINFKFNKIRAAFSKYTA